MNLKNEIEVAKGLAIKAGNIIMNIYAGDFSVEYKVDHSPLTLADKGANKIIINGIMEQFPHHSYLSEEIQDDKSRLDNDWCWVIDPLDGTKEFIKKNGEFTVNIALVYKQNPVLGVILAPDKKELYYAVKGEGAYLESNHKKRKASGIQPNR